MQSIRDLDFSLHCHKELQRQLPFIKSPAGCAGCSIASKLLIVYDSSGKPQAAVTNPAVAQAKPANGVYILEGLFVLSSD